MLNTEKLYTVLSLSYHSRGSFSGAANIKMKINKFPSAPISEGAQSLWWCTKSKFFICCAMWGKAASIKISPSHTAFRLDIFFVLIASRLSGGIVVSRNVSVCARRRQMRRRKVWYDGALGIYQYSTFQCFTDCARERKDEEEAQRGAKRGGNFANRIN